jgi:hypothetical protein
MLSITPSFKIEECIDRATNNQQYINNISPNRKIKGGENMDVQNYPFFIPHPVTIGNLHPESVIAIPQIGISDNRALAHRQPICIKAVQLIHNLTHPRSLEVQCRHTERERVLIGLKYKFVGKGDTLFQRRAGLTYIYIFTKQ